MTVTKPEPSPLDSILSAIDEESSDLARRILAGLDDEHADIHRARLDELRAELALALKGRGPS